MKKNNVGLFALLELIVTIQRHISLKNGFNTKVFVDTGAIIAMYIQLENK